MADSLQERDRRLFDRIAREYLRKDLHPAAAPARAHRLRRSLRTLDWPGCPKILEVGCGTGFSARWLEGQYAEYLGIDHSAGMIDIARRVNGRGRARFECASLDSLSDNSQFDVVLMIGVLHHMEDPREALQQIRARLTPGGFLIANEPQSTNPLIQRLRRLRKRWDATYSEEQETFDAGEFYRLAAAAGFAEIHVLPQGLLTTPFAEVPLSPSWLFRPISQLACRLDTFFEDRLPELVARCGWNLVLVARVRC